MEVTQMQIPKRLPPGDANFGTKVLAAIAAVFMLLGLTLTATSSPAGADGGVFTNCNNEDQLFIVNESGHVIVNSEGVYDGPPIANGDGAPWPDPYEGTLNWEDSETGDHVGSTPYVDCDPPATTTTTTVAPTTTTTAPPTTTTQPGTTTTAPEVTTTTSPEVTTTTEAVTTTTEGDSTTTQPGSTTTAPTAPQATTPTTSVSGNLPVTGSQSTKRSLGIALMLIGAGIGLITLTRRPTA
ncbi:MAG: hypothetical protein M3Q14_02850 [bacterium]|nr:hypothetical protein [bacterium]